jgi:hypothetical protein
VLAQFIVLTNHLKETVMKSLKLMLVAASAMLISFGAATPASASAMFASGIPAGWTCNGNCGADGTDGVVSASPAGGIYGYVSTYNSTYYPIGPVNGGTSNGNGTTTNGSVLTSSVFSSNAGNPLQFYFNFVTADGAGWADYAWANLVNTTNPSSPILLFTARTTQGGSSVPGFQMPLPAATITPNQVNVNPGATTWSPLGPNLDGSGACFGGVGNGCGSTGWVTSDYNISLAGNYYLEFGVANWGDTNYQTGMAFDGITVAGTPIGGGNTVPEPASLALLGIGLAGLVAMRRRSKMA